MLGISDLYEKFCLDEAADYIYSQLLKEVKPKDSKHNKNNLTGNEMLLSLSTPKVH